MSTISVLYVDDEPALLDLCRLFLERTGDFSVRTAVSGEEALAIITASRFDAIVSDYQMPEMDGIEFLKRVRQSNPSVPFILFTGKGREEVVIEAINNGADFYLQKGGDPKTQFVELQHKIRQSVRRKTAEETLTRRNEELQAAYEQLAATDVTLRDNYRTLTEQQARLSQNEEKYRNLFEAESDAIVLIDNATGAILEANSAASALYGLSHTDLLQKRNSDLSAEPEEAVMVTEETPVQSDKVVTIPLRFHKRQDGTVFPVEITGRFFTWRGRPVHIAAIRDITDRFRAAEASQLRTEKVVRYQRALVQLATTDAPTLRSALNRITETGSEIFGAERVSIWFYTENGKRLACNDLYIRSGTLHTSGTELSRLDYPRYFAALQENRAIIAPDAAIHPQTSEFSLSYLKPLGISSMLDIPVRAGKEVIGVLCIEHTGQIREWTIEDQDAATALADYTAIVLEQARRRLAEKELKKGEEKYRAVVDRANDGIVIIQDNVLAFVNPKAAEILGTAPANLLGAPYLSIVAPQQQEIVRDHLEGRMRGETAPQVYETVFVSRSGSRIDVEVNAGVIPFDGKPADLVFVRDITERKRSEQALRVANQKLNLLSSVTRHDILNKLTIVIGYLELAKLTHDRDKLEDFIGKIDSTLQIIEQQIQFTRDYQDIGVRQPEWQDAACTFDQAAIHLDTRDIAVSNNLSGLSVYADPLFGKVMYNILDNSLQYGQTLTTITASFRRDGDRCVLVIEDDGVGVAAKDKGRIFDKGFGQHTGLGLFLAKEILSLTGIEIMETGFPGKGARFELHIPEGRFRLRDQEQS